MSNANTNVDKLYGLPPGPFAVGVRTYEFTDPESFDPGDSTQKRTLQTELWYPSSTSHDKEPVINQYSDFVGLDTIPDPAARAQALQLANRAFGGYRDGLTVAELDATVWQNRARRNAVPLCNNHNKPFPLVLFSHGSGAYRASYIYWCEFLASHGYVVAACDHPGSARFTVVNGQAIVPNGGPRSVRRSMEHERPRDLLTVLRGVRDLAKTTTDVWAGVVDCQRVALTGMSFGGYTVAACLELLATENDDDDISVQAAVLQCPSLGMSAGGQLATAARKNRHTPVLVMLGGHDTVIGAAGNEAARQYVDTASSSSYLLELKRAGHVSFTSCEIYNPNYGNGIATAGQTCPSLDGKGVYEPLDIVTQHGWINTYGLAFLNAHLKSNEDDAQFLKRHAADPSLVDEELIFRGGRNNK